MHFKLLFAACCALVVQGAPNKPKHRHSDVKRDPHPESWVKVEDLPKEYYFSLKKPRTWIQAFRFCAEINATLISIETQHENHMINDYIIANYPDPKFNWWTSGSVIYTRNRQWVWMSTGRGFTFKDWCKQEPDNKRGNEYCCSNHAIRRCWSDNPCGVAKNRQKIFYTVCERPRIKSLKKAGVQQTTVQDTKVPLALQYAEVPLSQSTKFWSPCFWFVRYANLQPQWQVRCSSPLDMVVT